MSDAVKVALLGAVCSLVTLLLNRLFSKRDKKENKESDSEKRIHALEDLAQTQKESLEGLQKKHEEDMASNNKELTIICYGVLASLKGLAEKGCDGPVHEAISLLEKHLNVQAHS